MKMKDEDKDCNVSVSYGVLKYYIQTLSNSNNCTTVVCYKQFQGNQKY